MKGGVTSSSRYLGCFRRFGLCVVGFAGGIADGLEVEEFYEFFTFNAVCGQLL
jgi:hypothetical protein